MSDAGTRGPASASTPTANAMSVADGIAQPCLERCRPAGHRQIDQRWHRHPRNRRDHRQTPRGGASRGRRRRVRASPRARRTGRRPPSTRRLSSGAATAVRSRRGARGRRRGRRASWRRSARRRRRASARSRSPPRPRWCRARRGRSGGSSRYWARHGGGRNQILPEISRGGGTARAARGGGRLVLAWRSERFSLHHRLRRRSPSPSKLGEDVQSCSIVAIAACGARTLAPLM